MKINFRKISLVLIFLAFFMNMPSALLAEDNKPLVYTVTVEDMVTAGTFQHINRTINLAEKYNAAAIVIKLNTPGGLVNSTLDIISAISATDIPVITYVTPSGAIAASAGTFILISGHVAAMTPGTTCGAAMPVTMPTTGESPEAADQKTINFLAEHMKTIGEDRGRPGDVVKRFVTENLSMNANEALKEGVIEYTADNLDALLAIIDGTEVTVNNELVSLNTAAAKIVDVETILEEKITNVVSNPTIAVILLMLGIYGLIIGFNSPGFLLPEVLGAICLILGLYGMGSFEVNLAAGLFLLLGVGLLIAEAFTPTYGVLAAGGIISIVLGIVFMPIEPMMPTGWFKSFRFMAVGVGLVGAGLVSVMLAGIWRLRKISPMHGRNEFRNTTGLVIEELNPHGRVSFKGEIWNATSEDQTIIAKGEKVEIVSRQSLALVVKKAKK
ncbi:MAG TPA: nodulation protein NfeD [Syntrophomonadaceae bacterium]|nr:nodulation protein NfeD [Syntrophomonadaceae bacterium]